MKNKIFLNIFCFFCDLSISYLLLYFFFYLKPSQIPVFSSYFLILSTYFLITFLIFKRSIFQLLFHLEIKTKARYYLFLKVLLIGVIPFFLTYFHKTILFTLFLLLLIVSCILVAVIAKKSIWQLVSRSIIIKTDSITFRRINKYLILSLIILTLIAIVDVGCTVFQKATEEPDERNIFSFLVKEKFALPVSSFATKKYAKNINITKQNHLKYIYNLFEKNDIVIISERLHPEYTQWQLFSQIILNDTFAAKVGNVCTEFGNINNQQVLDEYLSTTFSNEEELKKETAFIVRSNGGSWPLWTNKNIYDFIINLYNFNLQKDSMQKINLFFSDRAWHWDNITTPFQYKKAAYESENRDSIMAVNIISKYKELALRNYNRKKILVIENTRHAYKEYKSTANYIYKELPDKTANVLINNLSLIFSPAKAGLWDAAASQVKDSVWAINFNESILGKDHFDLYLNLRRVKYRDVFNGMIYYKHPKDFRLITGYDYILKDYEETFIKRTIISGKDSLFAIKEIRFIEEQPVIVKEAIELRIFNLLFACFHFFILLFLLLILVIQLGKNLRKQ